MAWVSWEGVGIFKQKRTPVGAESRRAYIQLHSGVCLRVCPAPWALAWLSWMCRVAWERAAWGVYMCGPHDSLVHVNPGWASLSHFFPPYPASPSLLLSVPNPLESPRASAWNPWGVRGAGLFPGVQAGPQPPQSPAIVSHVLPSSPLPLRSPLASLHHCCHRVNSLE